MTLTRGVLTHLGCYDNRCFLIFLKRPSRNGREARKLFRFILPVIFWPRLPFMSREQILKDKYEPGAHPQDCPHLPVYEGNPDQENEEDCCKDFSSSP